MYTTPYVPPTLTVDSVIFQLIEKRLHVLLIKRAGEPFAGCWALPGGYCASNETTTDAIARVTAAKAGIDTLELPHLEQLYTFDTVARDPRGHAVSVTYLGTGRDLVPAESATTQTPGFFPVDELPELAYDHADIVAYGLQRLQLRLNDTNIAYSMLSPAFTLTELQQVYEAVFGRAFDKRNFRKKFLSLELIEDTGEVRRHGASRPASLYRFREAALQPMTRSID